jgi:ABC-type glutathione transport system ATPase component
MMDSYLLQLELSIRYGQVTAVDSAKLDIRPAEIVALVGESGSGKSSLALAILGVTPAGTALQGHIQFEGRELLELNAEERRIIRSQKLAYVPQDASACLSPWKTIRKQLHAFWKLASPGPAIAFEQAVVEALQAVALDPGVLDRYPAQLSIGQCQRVAIANALLRRPALIIADEPTSALDRITAGEITKLFAALRRNGTAILLISHDLSLAGSVADRIAILYRGRTVEFGTADQIFDAPAHPYTRALFSSISVREPGTLQHSEKSLPLQ